MHRSLRLPTILSLIVLATLCLALPYATASEMTVIITSVNSTDCRVLEFDTLDPASLDAAIPKGWVRLDMTREQCEIALPLLKEKKDLDNNVKGYLDLLSCEKENTLRSLSYLGLGGKEICKAAGLGFIQERLVIGAPPAQRASVPWALYGGIGLAIIALALLLAIFRKRRHQRPGTDL